uniref:TATA binding protein associated factor n=1 Tax=Solanum tuberosum TaxID=4113 RepID=M1A174_SOLTU
MAGLMQSSQFHRGNFHGQSFQGCRQWETGNNGISQFELSTESASGPCICPTKDEQRSTKEEVVSANSLIISQVTNFNISSFICN